MASHANRFARFAGARSLNSKAALDDYFDFFKHEHCPFLPFSIWLLRLLDLA
jgi:hypothetical protein